MDTAVTTLLARQPIFDANQQVVAYELLFRSGTADKAQILDPDLATSQLLINALGSRELDQLLGQHKAFINCTRNLMINPLLIDPKRHVLELLEDQVVDTQLIDALKVLKHKGFVLALDDFLYSPEWEPALALADIVKVDLLQLADDAELIALTERLKGYNVRLLAEKVEDPAMFERCKELGYELFQGYFLCKPQPVKARSISPVKHAVLELLRLMQQPDIEFDALAEVVKRDASLSLKLIRIANSAFYAPRRPIERIGQALTLMGLDHLRRLVSALALTQLDDKPHELAVIALQRAQMAYNLGPALGANPQHLYFLGLLSTLDAFMDQALSDALRPLHLSDESLSALLERSGTSGQLLQWVLDYSSGNWDALDWPALEAAGLDQSTLAAAYIQSVQQANCLPASC